MFPPPPNCVDVFNVTMSCFAGGSKEKEVTLDDVWEAKVDCGGGAGMVEVGEFKCWQGPAGSDWHDISDDGGDEGADDDE